MRWRAARTSDRHATDRCLIADLDSTTQAEKWAATAARRTDEFNQPEHVRWFSGILRATDLLSSQIVLTDPQLLDGAFFLDLGPDRVREILGRETGDDGGITVVTRQRPGNPPADLVESLRALVVSPGSDTMKSFRFSGVRRLGVDPVHLEAAMTSRPVGPVLAAPREQVADVIAHELALAYDDPGKNGAFARLAAEWSAWIAAADDGRINLEMAERGADVAAALAGSVARLDEALPARAPSPGDDELVAIVKVEAARTTAWSATERIGHGPTKRLVKWWYDAAYAQAFADMMGSSWIAYDVSADVSNQLLRDERSQVPIRGTFRAALGEMPNATFTDVRYRAREAIASWLSDSTVENHRALSYVVHVGSSQPKLADVRRRALKLIGVGAVAVVLAGVGEVADTDLTILAVVVALVSASLGLPYDALLAENATRGETLDAVLFVRGAGQS